MTRKSPGPLLDSISHCRAALRRRMVMLPCQRHPGLSPTPVNRSPTRRYHGLALVSLIFLAGRLVAAEPAATPPKTHRLYMGLDLSIVAKGKQFPVQDIQNNSYVINGPQGRVVIPAQDTQFQLKTEEELKLGTTLAQFDKFSLERAYTPGRDPMQKFQEAARVANYSASSVDSADAAVRAAETGLGLASGGLAQLGADALPEAKAPWLAQQASAQAQVASAEALQSSAQAMDRTEAFSTTASSNRMTSDLGAEEFDALAVTFEVSSPRPLGNPYVVILMRFLEAKNRPETARVWVYAEKLPGINEHPRSFRIMRGGFPPGYQIESYHVHLYDADVGSEIATSLSRKQVALTADEAFEYSVIQHIGTNRDKTKSPIKAKGFWPADLPRRLSPGALDRRLYVKVGKDGMVLGLFDDEACSRPVNDAELTAVVPELRFLPALEKGKPVVGVAALKLGNSGS